MNSFSLTGKGAVITGGTAGIGLAVAKSFIEAGCQVVITGRRENSALASSIGARFLPMDVTDEESCIEAFQEAKNLLGSLDILVLNAGTADGYCLEDATDDLYQRDFDINVKGVLHGLRHGGKLLASGGSIIVTSSGASWLSMDEASIYSASKAAATSLVRSAAIEFAPKNIRVNAVSPGSIKTEMAFPERFAEVLAPLKRIGTPEDLTGAYLLLASDAGRYITGADIVIDGGLSAGLSKQLTDWVFGGE